VTNKKWRAINSRRGALIHKEVYGHLSQAGARELDRLQHYADKMIDRKFPIENSAMATFIKQAESAISHQKSPSE
jgi:hypothetical protein